MTIQQHRLGRWELNDGYKRHYFDSQQAAIDKRNAMIKADRLLTNRILKYMAQHAVNQV